MIISSASFMPNGAIAIDYNCENELFKAASTTARVS